MTVARRPPRDDRQARPPGRGLRLASLADLAVVQAERAAAARAEAERQRQLQEAQRLAREAQRRAERERQFFAESVGPVTPLPPSDRAAPSRPLPTPEPRQRWADERAALQQSLDAVDPETLLWTDDGLSHRRLEVPYETVVKLRLGQWAIQGELDLHGLRREEAREQLREFIRQASRAGHRCLRIVHGKGKGSPGREPVLKEKVHRWLVQCEDVIAFVQASGPEGGAGALRVLLKG